MQRGYSALIKAGSTDIVLELVKAGANLNLQNRVYTTKSATSSSQTLVIYSAFIPMVSPQNGDSTVIMAVLDHKPAILRELVRAGSDLNLQNQVRYTVTVDTLDHYQLSILGGSYSSNDSCQELEN